MAKPSAHSGIPYQKLASLPFVEQELKRIPLKTRRHLRNLGLGDDLEQELHLAYYKTLADRAAVNTVRRALHAAGERLRYREVVRPTKYQVPEERAGDSYHRLVYGIEPNPSNKD